MRKENHLKGQTSPYLLQHLYNPVDWYPWGEEALEKSRTENKPLLISIGYSACHWCHVMEKESFEDHEVAQLMNSAFIPVKVDREERPDVDHLYMNAVHLIGGRGGWPLNCFALPDGKPFWGGTYFPRDQWISILNRITELFKNNYKDLEEQANKITQGIEASSMLTPSAKEDPEPFREELIHAAAKSVLKNVDNEEGGTTGAPKFPLPAVFEFLLHYHRQTGDQESASSVKLSLEKMALGGIYDQVGGGFSRYSVDDKWKVPHFEKMLYDNAQLVSLYSKAWQQFGDPLFEETVRQTLSFVERELMHPGGTFYAALDADSEGEEGKYYVWAPKDFDQAVGSDASLARKYYNVEGEGYWENGNNILLRKIRNEEFAKQNGLEVHSLKSKVKSWNNKLLKYREYRERPGLDSKQIVSWNSLMITALADAYKAFGEQKYKDLGCTAADFIIQHALESDGKIFHTLNNDKPAIDGFLEDYACSIRAMISLYEITFDGSYLLKAESMIKYVFDNFSSDTTRMFRFSSQKGEKLVADYYDFQDNVIPSANSIMARNLFYLGNLLGKQDWTQRSMLMLLDMESQLKKYGNWTANWAMLGLHFTADFYTLAICGSQAEQYAKETFRVYNPDMIVCASESADPNVYLLDPSRFKSDKTLVYPCRYGTCETPIASIQELKQFLIS